MYKLVFNGQTVYDPRGANDTDQLIILEPSVSLAVNAAGSISFSMYPTHPMYGKITRMRGDLELLDDDGPIFRGRILDDEATFYGGKKYTAEGALAFLNDSMVDPYTFPDDFRNEPGFAAASQSSGNVVAWWLGWLLDKHNASAQPNRRIKLGTVTVRDPNNYITRENSNYSSTWETISEKLVGSALGGYMLIRYEDDGNYLDYLAELPGTNAQAVTFGQNLLDIIIKVTGSDLFTAILPVGADGLTLAGLPDGPLEGGLMKAGKIIYDPAAEAEYGGRITRTSKWDDVTVAQNLQDKAAEALRSGVRVPESITARACDLNGLDGSMPHFRVGQYVRIKSGPHGIDEAYPLLELNPNLLDPSETIISLNTTRSKFTAEVRRAQVAADEAMKSAISEASKEFNELLNNASGLYCTPDPQPDGSVIYYLHDKQTLAESTYVIKLTAEAIGFSTNGGATYPYGFTVTGEMVMNIIKATGISADYINTGTLNLALLKLVGTICGLMQGYGMTASGVTTQGIVMYGNGVDSKGNANPPYIIVTNAGIRGQTDVDHSFNMSAGVFEVNGSITANAAGDYTGNVTAAGNVTAGTYYALNGNYAIRDNNGQLWIGNNASRNVYLQGNPLYINDSGLNTYLRGNVDFSGANVTGLPGADLSGDVDIGGRLSVAQHIVIGREQLYGSVSLNAQTSASAAISLIGLSHTSNALWVGSAAWPLILHCNSLTSDKDLVVSSDRRLKKDIEPLAEVLGAKYEAVLDGLSPLRFRYKSEPDDSPYHLGYTHQDLAAALEAAGLTMEDMAACSVIKTEDGQESLGISYGELIALLHLKIMRLEKRIEALESG